MAGRYDNTPAWLDETVRAHLLSRSSSKSKKEQSRSDDANWHSTDPVKIAGYEIANPFAYVGQRLSSVETWFGGTEPALIDPRLTVEPPNERVRRLGLGYRLSYANLAPAARGVFLEWLSAGRSRGDIHVDFVRLFLFGVERRLLHDFVSHAGSLDEARLEEITAIRAELTNIARVFSHSEELGERCQQLDVVAANIATDASAPTSDPPPYINRWTAPAHLRYALGCIHASGQPLPAKWAIAWLTTAAWSRLKTPAKRCPQEFQELFTIRFNQHFPDGFFLNNKHLNKPLLINYRTDSWSLLGSFAIRTDLIDFGDDAAQVRPIADVASQCESELDAYSRYIGTNKDSDALGARALLPADLLHGTDDTFNDLRQVAETLVANHEFGFVPGTQLSELWDPEVTTLSRVASTSLAKLLNAIGFGLVPDPRFERQVVGTGNAVLYRLHQDASPNDPTGVSQYAPSTAANDALVICDLGLHVIANGGSCSDHRLMDLLDEIAEIVDLNDAEIRRLHAHARWRMDAGSRIAGIKTRIKELTVPPHIIADMLIRQASSGGFPETATMRGLHKSLELLGIDHQAAYRAMHHGDRINPTGAPGHTTDATTPGERVSFNLDHEVIAKTKVDSHRVSELLAGIFVDDDEVHTPAQTPANSEQNPPTSGPALTTAGIAGLDPSHSALLLKLSEQTSWTQDEFEALCSTHQLLPESAIDAINEAAFDSVGEAVVDAGLGIQVDAEVFRMMTE